MSSGFASVAGDLQHIVTAFGQRAEVLDPLRQALHEVEQLRGGSGRAVDPLAGCLAAHDGRFETFELWDLGSRADVGCNLKEPKPLGDIS